MNRKKFLRTLGVTALTLPMIGKLAKLEGLANELPSTDRMPVLFLGHGSPMNAIEDNEFVQGFKQQATQLQKPKAILVVSAHWETKGTYVTAMEQPKTIHDFGGFPQELFEQQYPAPGDPQLAQEISQLVQPAGTVDLDDDWGLDHGSWSVVKHLYPDADVPVLQLSIDYSLHPAEHYALAQQLSKLRYKGVLIVGSGNIVHNLRRIAFNRVNEAYGFDWALEARSKINQWIAERDHQSLINFKKQGRAFDLAIPTPEHYLPLLYAVALQENDEEVLLFNDKPIAGSLTMTSLKIG